MRNLFETCFRNSGLRRWYTGVFAALFLLAVPLSATEPLRVFAAAGTMPAMKELGLVFTEKTGIPVAFNFSGSGTLARQILAGAPFDVFLSANSTWMDAVGDSIDGCSRVRLLEGELVVIVPKGSPVSNGWTPAQFAPMKRSNGWSGVFAVGDRSVPVGMYAEEALKKLGWWTQLQGDLCRGDSVAKVFGYVALGEADAGIVYRSVAICGADRVDITSTIPAELHAPIYLPIAVAKHASPQAVQFFDMLQGEHARSVFEQQGWRVVAASIGLTATAQRHEGEK